MRASRYSTMHLPPERRVSAWEEHLAQSMASSQCRPFAPESLLIEHASLSTEQSTVHALSVNAHMVDRTLTAQTLQASKQLYATIVVTGGVTYYSTSSTFAAGPGDALVYNPDVPFFMAFLPGTTEVVLTLDEFETPQFSDARSCFLIRLPSQERAGLGLHDHRSLYEALSTKNLNHSGFEAQIDSAVRAWNRVLMPHEVPYVQEALRCIASRAFDDTLRIEDVAAHVGISSRHLVRVLGNYGTTAGAEITRTRIAAAKRLLEAGSLPIGQVALECGFGSASNFSRVFSKATGNSPSQWRSQRAA